KVLFYIFDDILYLSLTLRVSLSAKVNAKAPLLDITLEFACHDNITKILVYKHEPVLIVNQLFGDTAYELKGLLMSFDNFSRGKRSVAEINILQSGTR